MPKVRQLAGLYLRGSLAHELKKLTNKERQELNDRIVTLSKSEELSKTKRDFINKLRYTIKSDYKDDPSTAEAEFDIALTRALIYVYYQHEYTYKCGNCGKSEHKNKKFDTNLKKCPACQHTKSLDGKYVQFNQTKPKERLTPMIAVQGKRKSTNIEEDQTTEFISKFIIRYRTQILRENRITFHTVKTKIEGPPEKIAIIEIEDYLLKKHIKYAILPEYNYTKINVSMMAMNLKTNIDIITILMTYEKYGMEWELHQNHIILKHTFGTCIASTTIEKQEMIMMQSQCSTMNDDEGDNDYIINQKDTPKMLDVEIDRVETNDLINNIEKSLPEEVKPLFNLLAERGSIYDDYHSEFKQNGPLNTVNLSKFFGVPSKQIAEWYNTIRTTCLSKGITS